jgi:hypothetical protein
MSFFRRRGDKAAIAKEAGISPNHFYEILARKRGVSKERAVDLELASGKILGTPIGWDEWLFNKISKHPAFEGKPIKQQDH